MSLADSDEKISHISSDEGRKKELFAFDYDGTLTTAPATIDESTLDTLVELRRKRNPLIGIVSGRQLPFLLSIRRQSEIFDFLIAENGAIIYTKTSNNDSKNRSKSTNNSLGGKTKIFGVGWAEKAREAFRHSDIPMDFGEIVIATKSRFEVAVRQKLTQFRLRSNLELNKGSLMVLPPGVDKGSALKRVVGSNDGRKRVVTTCFGDGENDIKMFEVADKAIAVANAVPLLKERADEVTELPGGGGVETFLRESLI